jgi:hypothetical protein
MIVFCIKFKNIVVRLREFMHFKHAVIIKILADLSDELITVHYS